MSFNLNRHINSDGKNYRHFIKIKQPKAVKRERFLAIG